MIKTPILLQDLRKKIYIQAKSEKTWRFWGIYVHMCKIETLRESYRLARKNNGAPGIDKMTFEDIERNGVESFLHQIHNELKSETYYPLRNRLKEIPKASGKGMRKLLIPSIRDRVVQGALKLILEPIFEADFQQGSYGYRPSKNAQEAVQRIADDLVKKKGNVIDADLKDYYGSIRHDILLTKLAKRVKDSSVMRLLKLIIKAGGKSGICQGGPLSPLLSNIYLTSVDEMLERAKEATKIVIQGKSYTNLEYYRWADDIVILVDSYQKWEWLFKAAYKRLREELSKIRVTLNTDKTRLVYAEKGNTFSFLGFRFKRIRTRQGKEGVLRLPKIESRTKLLRKLKEVFRQHRSHHVRQVIDEINPILRGWVSYFRIGNSSECFAFIKDWVEKKLRRHLIYAQKRQGFGWKRWSKETLYKTLGLYNGYHLLKVTPVQLGLINLDTKF